MPKRSLRGLVLLLLWSAATPHAAGLAPQAADTETPIAGTVYLDRNVNGVRDAGEPGIANVAVSNQIDVTTSAADGTYRLRGRGYGIVFVSMPAGHTSVGAFWRDVSNAATSTTDFPLAAAPASDSFTFIHASDTHISPESVERTRRLGAIAASRAPSFVIVSGDLVKDALRVDEKEARGYYELYTKETRAFPVPVWSGPGNHEIFGIERHLSLVSPQHPLYEKRMYRHYLGPNYYSFNHGRIHFVGLDSVDVDDLWYYGHVDAAQLRWLEQDLAAVPRDTPIVTFNHIPLFSAGPSVAGFTDIGPAMSTIRIGDRIQYRHVVSNTSEVLARLAGRRYALALGGHNHAFERLLLQPGTEPIRFHLAAAVIGPTTGAMPSPAGVTLYHVRGTEIDDGEFIALDPPRP